ncbi:MAG TPA: DUF1206 domain-containing protein [Trebonia sp.]
MSTILGSPKRRRYPTRRRRGAAKPAGSGALNLLTRLGLVVRGIVYFVIGAIAVMLALGVARHSPDTAGALEAIATRPFGFLLLWVLVIGFLGLAVWRFVQAAVKRLNETEGHRVMAFLFGLAYAALFYSTLMFVVHGRRPAGSDATARDFTRTVLTQDGGPIIVALVGVALVIVGVVMAIRGLSARFTEYLRMGWMSRSTQNLVVRLGQAGYVARGVVVAAIGVAAFDAAVTYKASRAEGIDGVLRSFAQTDFGPWLLLIIALGLIAFGVLSFLEAKWRRTLGGVPV